MKHIKKYFLVLIFCLSLCGCGTSSELGQNIQDVLQELPTEEITDVITDTITDTIVDLLQPTATPTPIGQQPQPSSSGNQNQEVTTDFSVLTEITLDDIPKYTTEAFAVVNDNIPFFTVDKSFTRVPALPYRENVLPTLPPFCMHRPRKAYLQAHPRPCSRTFH